MTASKNCCNLRLTNPDRPEESDPQQIKTMHHLEAAMKAEYLFRRDKDYIVRKGQVIIVDEFTGRLMAGRRWSDGLHQAVEAKEKLPIQQESVTYATITLQNYFRLYKKLAGMTGTAKTEEDELYKVYGLNVVVIPTNRPMVRVDQSDLVYRNEEAKWRAVALEIAQTYTRGQPTLIGTTSVEQSERLSRRFAADKTRFVCARAFAPAICRNRKIAERQTTRDAQVDLVAPARRCAGAIRRSVVIAAFPRLRFGRGRQRDATFEQRCPRTRRD